MHRKGFLISVILVVNTQLGMARNEVGVKTFIPGMVQLSNKETVKGWSIIGVETITMITGGLCWYWSDNAYDKYKRVPKGASQAEFDNHLKQSELYGTAAIGSFVVFGGTYLYSVVDAIWFSKGEGKRTGFYFIPERNSMNLCAIIKF